MMKDDWIDPGKLNNTGYLGKITSCVYIMQSGTLPNTYHVGIVGRDSQKNNAKKRVQQVNRGNNNLPPAPFTFIFLAPMPSDLCFKLLEVEALLQNELSKNFGGRGHRPNWIPTKKHSVIDIQKIATITVLCFLQNRYAGSASALIRALHPFNASPAVPFFQDPKKYDSVDDFLVAENARQEVFAEVQKIFDSHLALALLKCLHNNLSVSGLPPCNSISLPLIENLEDFVDMED